MGFLSGLVSKLLSAIQHWRDYVDFGVYANYEKMPKSGNFLSHKARVLDTAKFTDCKFKIVTWIVRHSGFTLCLIVPISTGLGWGLTYFLANKNYR